MLFIGVWHPEGLGDHHCWRSLGLDSLLVGLVCSSHPTATGYGECATSNSGDEIMYNRCKRAQRRSTNSHVEVKLEKRRYTRFEDAHVNLNKFE